MHNKKKNTPTITLKDGLQKAEIGDFHTSNNRSNSGGNWKVKGLIIIILLLGFTAYRLFIG